MGIWRPQHQIKVKAIGLIWKGKKFLAAEVTRDDGTVKGVRPLGGSLEFGETWQEALKREFQEELNAELEIVGSPTVLENIFTHENTKGHEIIFVAEGRLPDSFYETSSALEFAENDGSKHIARWFSLSDLDSRNLELYPNGLAAYLE